MEMGINQASTYAVWQKWAKALQRQLERIAEIYEAHEEGAEAQKLKNYIDRLKLFVDPVAHAQELARRNYDVKGSYNKLYMLAMVSLQLLFREALSFLLQVSEDMQRILDSSYINCNGRTASDVFKGPHGTQYEGIGNGLPDLPDRLPWVLYQLLEQADVGGEEYLHRGLQRVEEPADALAEGENAHPDRHEYHQRNKKITATGVQ
ncbi:MAG: hypothetical protein HY053_00945 [Proteobacteria bacterium]|nr:hypothetical protein [Pseudomonadota bacterium]